MSLLMCFMMCFTYVFKRKKVFDIWPDIFYITQNLESCQEVIRMLLSPQASCLKTKKATSLPASHWKHFTFTFRGHFQGCLFVKATENQLHHIKSGKKTKVSHIISLSTTSVQKTKICSTWFPIVAQHCEDIICTYLAPTVQMIGPNLRLVTLLRSQRGIPWFHPLHINTVFGQRYRTKKTIFLTFLRGKKAPVA